MLRYGYDDEIRRIMNFPFLSVMEAEQVEFKLRTDPTFIHVRLLVKWGNLFLYDPSNNGSIVFNEPIAESVWIIHLQNDTAMVRFPFSNEEIAILEFPSKTIFEEFRRFYGRSNAALRPY